MRKLLLAVLLLVPVVALAGQTVKRGPGGGSGTAATTTFTPTGGIAATDVQAMGAEIDAEKANTADLAITLIGGVGGVADVRNPNDLDSNDVHSDPIVCLSAQADCSYLSTISGWWLALSSDGATTTVWRPVEDRADQMFRFREEFTNVDLASPLLHANNTWNYSIANGATIGQRGSSTHYGNLLLTTNIAADAAAIVHQHAAALDRVVLLAGMEFSAAIGHRPACVSGTDDCQFIVGLCDDVTPADGLVCADGVWFEYTAGTSANWLVGTARNDDGTPTVTTTSVPVANKARLRWVASASTPDANGTADTVTFYINGAVVATHTTDIMDANGTRASKMYIALRKINGTTSKFTVVDYYDLTAYPRHDQ